MTCDWMRPKVVRKAFVGACVWFVICTVGVPAQTTVTNGNDGTANTVPVYTGSSTLGNSVITQSGGNVGIGTTNPIGTLNVVDTSIHAPSLAKGSPASFVLDMSGAELVFAEDGAPNYENYIQSKVNWGVSTTPLSINPLGGNVGIGTTSPGAVLDVIANPSGSGQLPVEFQRGSNYLDIDPMWGGVGSGGPVVLTSNGNIPQVSLQGSGNVGIGTTSPGAKLEVDGNLKLTSGSGASITFADGTQQTTAWTGTVCGGDYAESIDVAGKRPSYQPGDVLVIDPHHPGKFLKSFKAYSTSVTGIYSTKPGLVGRRQGDPKSPDAVPMAMIGIVPTKVSAENGPIHPGDLLVTSSTVGYAMKGTDRGQMLGAVIGKALGSLNSGKGVIEVVVTLQ